MTALWLVFSGFLPQWPLRWDSLLVRGNPLGLVIILGNSEFSVSSESRSSLTQKTVGYPSRKGVDHFFSEKHRYGLIPTCHVRYDILPLESPYLRFSKKKWSTPFLEGYPTVFWVKLLLLSDETENSLLPKMITGPQGFPHTIFLKNRLSGGAPGR